MAANPNFDILLYKPEYKDQILQLEMDLWGQDKALNEAYFNWKYKQNPFHDVPVIFMAVQNNQVIGVRGFIGSVWQAGTPDKSCKVLELSDSVTHADYRRIGVFSKISQRAVEELSNRQYSFIFNLSSGPLSTSGNLKLGWDSIGANIIGSMTIHPQAKARQKIRKALKRIPIIYPLYRRLRGLNDRSAVDSQSAGSNIIAPFEDIDYWIGKSFSPNVEVSREPRPVEMAGLVARKPYDGRMRQVRNEAYFAWRYKNPRSEYRFIFWNHDQLEGYLVLRTAVDDSSVELKIVDWEVSELGTLAKLLHFVIRTAKWRILTIWGTGFNRDENELFSELGFKFEVESGNDRPDFIRPSVLIKPIQNDLIGSDWEYSGINLLNAKNWDLRSIYSDGF